MNTSTAPDHQLEPAWTLLRRAIAQRAFPGAAVAITVGGDVVALRGFGRMTYDPGTPESTGETIYDLASLTKVLATTAMAMVLYERGQLDLEAPVGSLLAGFGGEGERTRVTVRMLLAHTSGLPAYARLFETAKSRDDLIAAACRMPLEAAPGERTLYSDIGFIVLGELLERLAGEPLDTFCSHAIFEPLGMARTGFRPPPEWREQIPPTEDDQHFRRGVVQGEVHDENAWVMGGVAGHAGLFAPAADVARFAACMMRGGAPIFRPETVRLFTEPAQGSEGRALGWDRVTQPSSSGRYFSELAFGHLGYTGTSLWIEPDAEFSIALLSNRTWPHRESQQIKQVRPAFHDSVVECIGLVD